MRTRHVPVLVRLVAAIGVLLTCVSGCRLTSSHTPAMRWLSLPASATSVLVIITNPDSPLAMRATGALAISSARPGERLLILSAHDGAVLASSQAPPSPGMQVAEPPAVPPAHATSFQKARYAQAVQQYQKTMLADMATLRSQQQEELAAWARSAVAKADAKAILRSARNASSISADLGSAASDLFSLRQVGLGYGTGTVIAIMGVDATTARFAPTLPSGLRSSSVVADSFSGSSDEQAAWQSSLMQSGAARVVVLTTATEDQLVPVVQQGLDGAVTDTLTSVLFVLGQYKLQAAALPQMRRLLYLLTVRYPRATVTINGYTDNLPLPGGNLQLSQLRAHEVEQWLIAHGVAAGRLQAFGYGDTDPVAPNTAHGQPLNRRVVVVIDPATAAGAG